MSIEHICSLLLGRGSWAGGGVWWSGGGGVDEVEVVGLLVSTMPPLTIFLSLQCILLLLLKLFSKKTEIYSLSTLLLLLLLLLISCVY